MMTSNQIVEFVRDIYQTNDFIPLHIPTFYRNEKKYVLATIESTFVSSVGEYVGKLEQLVERFTGAGKAVATVNGTAALHTALYMAGVQPGDLVITQSLTFVATCNALYHMGAEPVFVDVSSSTLGLCPKALKAFLDEFGFLDDTGQCRHKKTNQKIKSVLPMHTFGHPAQLDELLSICKEWSLILVEDAAESLGSYYKGRHTGTVGKYAALSFNGNKIITTGGGGIVLCDSVESGSHTKHITTTAKQPHAYEFYHDEPGFNYRMPNLNAALGCAQMEVLGELLASKRELALRYMKFFKGTDYKFLEEPENCKSNYWLNAVICQDKRSRDQLLEQTNAKGVMTRPIWALMHRLPMFKNALRDDLTNSQYFEERVVNIPSSPVGIVK